jgi:hypothetical protein
MEVKRTVVVPKAFVKGAVIELAVGDLSKLEGVGEDAYDLLIVSAKPGDYEPKPR